MVMSSKISRLFIETSSFKGPIDTDGIVRLSAWLEGSKALDLELCGWDRDLPDNWLPLIVSSQTGESLITYQRLGVAAIWNYYRAIRVILQQLIINLRSSIMALTGDNIFQEGLQDDLEVGVIRKMITDACRSIPFARGEIDALGNPNPSSAEGRPRVRAIYGYIMLWPLWYMLSCGLATPAQSEQIRGFLAQVGSALGIKLALILAGDGATLNSGSSGPSMPYAPPVVGQFSL